MTARVRNRAFLATAVAGAALTGAIAVSSGEAGVEQPRCFGQPADIYRPDNQFVQGTNRGEVIVTGAPKNQIKAGGGDDLICSGANKDVVTGGGGNDRVDAGSGGDITKLGSGNDFGSGGPGRDLLNGGAGNDKITGKAGKDILDGKSGDDQCIGGKGADIASVDRCEVVRGAVTN